MTSKAKRDGSGKGLGIHFLSARLEFLGFFLTALWVWESGGFGSLEIMKKCQCFNMPKGIFL